MNILLVDDEIYCVRGISDSVRWDALGIDRVLTAYSMAQAIEVFESERVDILLADVEMPKGTGLDLLEWAHAHGHRPVTLFLTSHARFEYAQKAIQLQSIGYVLKPADGEKLEAELRRAVTMIRKDEEQKRLKDLADAWNSNHDGRLEAFWRDLLDGVIPPEADAVRRALQRRQLPAGLADQPHRLVLAHAGEGPEDDRWEKDLLDYAVRNVLTEVILDSRPAPVLRMGDGRMVMVCASDSPAPNACADPFLARCDEAARACGRSLPGQYALFVSAPGVPADAQRLHAELRSLDAAVLATESAAFSAPELSACADRPAPEIPLDAWTEALLTHSRHRISADLRAMLGGKGTEPVSCIARPHLHALYHGVLQVIFTAFEKRNAAASDRIADEEDATRSLPTATDSVEGFLAWADQALTHAENRLGSHHVSGSIVDSVRRYIAAHLSDETLNRSRIAAEIHLNPDYLSTLFKEKTGESLTSYITTERLKLARKLLVSTELPVGDIAMSTGYSDLAYFSRQFKQSAGISPQQYRKAANNQ